MILETKDIVQKYRSAGGRNAVNRASVTVDEGETVGFFGESGSGKSTLGLIVAGLLKPTSGEVFYKGQKIRMPYKGECRRNIQILFQHPETSFNPALTLESSMVEPYSIYSLPYSHKILCENISQYGLYEEHLRRLPSELSGGELQRAALARILTIKPKLIVLDEPTSMLDVITQVQIMSILRDYQRESGAAFIFVTHSRTLCEKVCDRIYDVESGVFREE